MNKQKTMGQRRMKAIFDGALGLVCWHVSVGSPTLPEFTLALGEKIKRETPLRNKMQPKVFRDHEGEASMMVRCPWRLEQEKDVATSSEDTERHITAGLRRIVGCKLVGWSVESPAWDLSLNFSNGLHLKAFCTRTEHESDLLKNWHARLRKIATYAGPGVRLQISNLTGN